MGPRRLPPLPWRHRQRVGPQPALRRPRLLLQSGQHRIPLRELSVPPSHPSPPRLLVQVPAVWQDDLGDNALVAIDVAHATVTVLLNANAEARSPIPKALRIAPK